MAAVHERDEVPRIIAKALLEAGVDESAITVIPDEQQAIDAAAGALILNADVYNIDFSAAVVEDVNISEDFAATL